MGEDVRLVDYSGAFHGLEEEEIYYTGVVHTPMQRSFKTVLVG
jgi:hypothetical protein